jgi:hypothetical protein
MASIQEQLKHIRYANDEWYDEHRKLVSTYKPFIPTHRRSRTNDVPCRLIGELAQLSRRATPDTRSLSSTPHPETTVSVQESESSRSRSDTPAAR